MSLEVSVPSSVPALAHDPEWPRTGGWADASASPADARFDLALIGIPTSQTSLSPSNAHETPAAIRAALRRYSGHVVAPGAPSASAADASAYEARAGHEAQLVIDEVLRIVDAGDAVSPDTEEGEIAATAAVAALAARSELVVALGGDNAPTVPAMPGIGDLDFSNMIDGLLNEECVRLEFKGVEGRNQTLHCKPLKLHISPERWLLDVQVEGSEAHKQIDLATVVKVAAESEQD